MRFFFFLTLSGSTPIGETADAPPSPFRMGWPRATFLKQKSAPFGMVDCVVPPPSTMMSLWSLARAAVYAPDAAVTKKSQ